MKGAQRRIETREQGSADLRITLSFGLLGFRSQPIVAAPLCSPHTQRVLSTAVHNPTATPPLPFHTQELKAQHGYSCEMFSSGLSVNTRLLNCPGLALWGREVLEKEDGMQMRFLEGKEQLFEDCKSLRDILVEQRLGGSAADTMFFFTPLRLCEVPNSSLSDTTRATCTTSHEDMKPKTLEVQHRGHVPTSLPPPSSSSSSSSSTAATLATVTSWTC
ncbi:unnamed protein product [Pleuronectes platessa]|uniref:Uncharacterized protein n=1 Tax=Pleuronectes platessa TaxID=8262 RepID=A0A9N7Y7A7_PLEPL|nr:unnamed protein product [Pleuronectes platessa]